VKWSEASGSSGVGAGRARWQRLGRPYATTAWSACLPVRCTQTGAGKRRPASAPPSSAGSTRIGSESPVWRATSGPRISPQGGIQLAWGEKPMLHRQTHIGGALRAAFVLQTAFFGSSEPEDCDAIAAGTGRRPGLLACFAIKRREAPWRPYTAFSRRQIQREMARTTLQRFATDFDFVAEYMREGDPRRGDEAWRRLGRPRPGVVCRGTARTGFAGSPQNPALFNLGATR